MKSAIYIIPGTFTRDSQQEKYMNMTNKLEAIVCFARAHGWDARIVSDNYAPHDVVKVDFGDHHFAVSRITEVYTMAGLLSAAGGRNEDGTEL